MSADLAQQIKEQIQKLIRDLEEHQRDAKAKLDKAESIKKEIATTESKITKLEVDVTKLQADIKKLETSIAPQKREEQELVAEVGKITVQERNINIELGKLENTLRSMKK